MSIQVDGLKVGDVIQVESHPGKYFRIDEMTMERITKLSAPYRDAGCRMPWIDPPKRRDGITDGLKRLNARRMVTIDR